MGKLTGTVEKPWCQYDRVDYGWVGSGGRYQFTLCQGKSFLGVNNGAKLYIVRERKNHKRATPGLSGDTGRGMSSMSWKLKEANMIGLWWFMWEQQGVERKEGCSSQRRQTWVPGIIPEFLGLHSWTVNKPEAYQHPPKWVKAPHSPLCTHNYGSSHIEVKRP